MANPFEELFSQGALGQYLHLGRLKTDIKSLLRTINSLHVCHGNFGKSSKGKDKLLAFVDGTIPIVFQSTQYNIPVTLYFPLQYPVFPPQCYVTPTYAMSIKKKHQCVALDGSIRIPYLDKWNSETSTLVDLVNTIVSIFSSNPPVYTVDSEKILMCITKDWFQNTKKLEDSTEHSEKRKDFIARVTKEYQILWYTTSRAIFDQADKHSFNLIRLKKHQKEIEQWKTKLEDDLKVLALHVEALTQHRQQLDDCLNDVHSKVDENQGIVEISDPHANCIMSLLCHLNSYEDLQLAYEDAFQRGILSLDAFLNAIRRTSLLIFNIKAIYSMILEDIANKNK